MAFGQGEAVTDVIFTVRQFVEKSWEHQSKAFLTFIDQRRPTTPSPDMQCA